MTRPPPKLRRKANGYFFVRFGGKDHYLGTTEQEKAERLYPKLIESWSDWKAVVRLSRIAPSRRVHTIDDVAEQFIDAKVAQRGPRIRSYYRTHLKLFREFYGPMPALTMTAQRVQAFQSQLVQLDKYQPKTINHHTIAVKALFNWAADMNLMPPLRLRGVRALPLGEPPDKSLSLAAVKAMVAKVSAASENAGAWLAVNYLTLARPIEVCRVVGGVGVWQEPGVFRLGKSKVESKTGVAKRLVFSDEALEWFAKCQPTWTRNDSYWRGVHALGGEPGRLRHSAATHLIRLYGIHRLDVESLLGHSSATRRESVRYAGIEWQQLRQTASLLSLR